MTAELPLPENGLIGRESGVRLVLVAFVVAADFVNP